MKRSEQSKELFAAIFCICLVVVFIAGCKPKVRQLESYPLDSLDGLISKANVELDPAISADGKGSLKITATAPVTVHLFETGDLDVENAAIVYQAKVRTEKLAGQTYLEMWCHFPSGKEFFSRGLYNPLSGDNEWASLETMFILKKGENPDNVSLNIVVDGKGTVWIDDITLTRGPLPK